MGSHDGIPAEGSGDGASGKTSVLQGRSSPGVLHSSRACTKQLSYRAQMSMHGQVASSIWVTPGNTLTGLCNCSKM